MRMPRDIGPVHFVGIGGIGMSGIAEVLHNLGYRVQGSDIGDNGNLHRLRMKNVPVWVGHDAAHLGDADLVVASSAVKPENPEILEARRRGIPIISRAGMLAELMRLKGAIAVGGTHGKTTTTSLIAALLDGGGFDPTVINGGIINAYGTNGRLGSGEWMVVEADESDGSFVNLPAEVVVVTNIDPEHFDHYGHFDAVKGAFRQFVERVPFYGFAVLCSDHPEVRLLAESVEDVRIITYGENPEANARLCDIRFDGNFMCFDVVRCDTRRGVSEVLSGLKLPMPGQHNALNSLAAIVVAREFGISVDDIRSALAEFRGIKRRFTLTGLWNGVSFFDDYAHHPVEISVVLEAARLVCTGNLIVIVQPHRYSRLRDLFDGFCSCFSKADTVIVADVYAAGEKPIDGINRDSLVAGIRRAGHKNVILLNTPEELPSLITTVSQSGDYVVFCGAGNITQWANALPMLLHDRSANVSTLSGR